MKTKISMILNFILIIALSISVFFLWQTNEKYKQLSLSLLNPEDGKHSVYIGGEWMDSTAFIVENERVYLSLEAFKRYIDSDVTLSGTGQRIYIKTANIRHTFKDPSLTAYVSQNLTDINVPLLYRDSVAYLDMKLIERLYPYSHQYFQEQDNLVVYSDLQLQKGQLGQNSDKYQVINSEMLKTETTSQRETIWILPEEVSEKAAGYYGVIDASGKHVYVKKKTVGQIEAVSVELADFELTASADIPSPFSLTFEVIDRYEDNFKKGAIAFGEGIDVISPTWFNLNVDGIIINSADLSYIEQAKHQGVAVWGLFKNNFDPKWTQTLVNSEAYQKKATAQMLMYSAIYDLDGINIDFENIYLKDQKALTAFVAELSRVNKAYGLTMSMDVTRPKGSDMWSKVYDRSALVKHIDYMVLMAYDEHWGSSPISGSVASMDWTEESITMSLEEIPAEKLVLGIPLYMRVWHEQLGSNGKYKKVGSQAITLKAFDKMKAERGLAPIYDSDSGQYYTEYKEGKDRYRIWIEDESALLKRLNLMEIYELPGVATWRRGFERNDTFSVIFDALRAIK